MPKWMTFVAVAGLVLADLVAAQEPKARGPGTPDPSKAETFALEVHEHELENGMQVLVVERPAAGRVGARLFVRVDVAAERPGTWGSTHMLEHSLFKGSRYIGTRDWEREAEVARRVERLARQVEDERNRLKDRCRTREAFVPDESEPACRGARLDSLRAAYQAAVGEQDEFTLGTDLMRIYQYAGGTNMTASTGTDWMKFDIDLPAEKLELFMYVERSRLEHPVFRQFDPEREVVVDQIRRAFNRPDGRFERTLQTMTYAAHPYGQAHWFSDLEGSQREDHWEIFHQFFMPQNAFLVVVGEIEAERVFSLAERWFGDWRPGRPPPRLRTVEPLPVGEKRLTAVAAAGPTVAVNARIPAVGHPDLPALDVLAELLGSSEGTISRALGDRASRVSVSAARRKYPGHFSIRADAPDNDGLATLEAGIDSVLQAVARGEVRSSEIDRAVASLRFRHVRDFETVGRSAVAIGLMHAMHDWRHLNELPGLWEQVGPDELARVTRAYLGPERRVVGILRRQREASSGAVRGWPTPAAGEGDSPLDRPRPEMGLAADVAARGAEAAGREGAVPDRRRQSTESVAAGGAQPEATSTEPIGEAVPHVPPAFDTRPSRAAERIWWTPPWMAEEPERFAGADVPEDWRDLELPTAKFQGPETRELRAAFDNGLQAFVVRDPYLPFVRITALLDVTPLEDPPGREGTTDLLIQLLRNGGTERLSPAGVDSALTDLGASVEVRVDRDVAEIQLAAPSVGAERAVRLLAELLTRPRFDDSVFQALRDRHAVRAERATDAARELLDRTFEAALYGAGHPLARRPSRQSVSAITREELTRLHRRRATPERTAWAVSGRIEPDAVRRAIAEVYGTGGMMVEGPVRAPRERELPAAAPPSGRRVVAVHREGMRQAHVLLGHLGTEERPEDAAALELTHYVLCGGGFGSRMMDLLRTRTGITAALYCHLEPGLGVRYPYAWRFSGNPGTIGEGILKALDQIAGMRATGPTASEVQNARTAYVEGYVPAAFDTPHKTATRLAHRSLLGLWPYTQVQYLNYYAGDRTQITSLQEVTLDDARRAAARWLHPDDLVIAVVGDLDAIRAGLPEEAEWLRKALER